MKKIGVVCLLVPLTGACFAQGWVVIPVNEYASLRGRAFPPVREPDTPPLDATLTRVDYDLKLDGALASGRATITFDVLKDGWVRLPIPHGILVKQASMDGTRIALTQMPGGSGELAAILSHRGRSVLTLDVAFAVTTVSGEQRLAVPTGQSGITRASIALAPQDLDVKVTAGFLPEKAADHWVAYARGGQPLAFTWRHKIEERRAELPLRMQGTLTELFGLGEDSTSLNADASITVLQGTASEVRVAVPAGVTINSVPGATVADWTVKDGELIVTFLDPVEHTAKFAITGEVRLPREGALEIPLLRLLGVERETGGAAVEVVGAAEIKNAKAAALDPADPSELGPSIASRQSPSMAAFVFRPGSAPRSLSVQVARYAQQAVLTANIEEARYRVLFSGDGKTLVEARFAVRNNQRTFARVALPTGATVWSSAVNNRPVRPGKAPDGSLLFPLAKSRAGEDAPAFAIEVLYLARTEQWRAKGRAELPLPMMDLPVSRTGVEIHYPPAFHVTAETGAFHAQPFEPPAAPALNFDLSFTPEPQAAAAPGIQALLDAYNARTDARKTTGALPEPVTFPALGPMLYLASELTSENHTPTIALDYQQDKKGGVR
jgi:hypothetical protein